MIYARQNEKVLFEAARNLADPAACRAFLDQACGGNLSLRTRLDELLAAQTPAEEFFDAGFPMGVANSDVTGKNIAGTSPLDGIFPNAEPKYAEDCGTRIGRYKLLQRLGEGGCGVVYMAEQEEPVRRRVALKVIRLGMDTENVIARFESERQALALMDHPNIARVLDAGATSTGRPYFIMELVRGTRITDYCDQNQLDTNHRLDLFIQICRAIQHAHQKGVIHRDIKPSNILVTLHDGVPVPKVIDFGIAKATEGRLTDKTVFTAYEQFIGTPAYMSPEQAELSGLDIDTRSDIYSLGVLLYELLTGKTPFDSKELIQSGVEQIRRTLRETEPKIPSAMLTTLRGEELTKTAVKRQTKPLKLATLLRGDLDWIVMKALEKDRVRRYETANGLAMDVQRYLDGEPIVARPPSQIYRFQKLVRRNKIVFGATAVVVVALAVGLGSSLLLLREQGRLRETAELSEQREAGLRQQAEDREKISQAATLLSQEKYDEADQLLGQVKVPPPGVTLNGVSAFRQAGEWLAIQGRWKQAGDRYSELMAIDDVDNWSTVTMDYLSCSVVLAESGDQEQYRRFCQSVIASFIGSTNGIACSRILKTSLLFPQDKKMMASLSPLADVAEKYFEPLASHTPVDAKAAWGSIELALWKYRAGDNAAAIKWCQRCLTCPDQLPTRIAMGRMILAMANCHLGQTDEARSQLAQGTGLIEAKFKNDLDRGDARQGVWWDWVFDRILMREAAALIGGTSNPADSDNNE
jgi:serine/threonine protein kinase